MQFHKVLVQGKEYAAIRLPEPDQFVGTSDQSWDYSENPYGPGTIGFEKSEEEIETLKQNYLLLDIADLDVLQKLNDQLGEVFAKARELQAQVSSYKIKALRATPHGVYAGEVVQGEALSSGGTLREDIDTEATISSLKEIVG